MRMSLRVFIHTAGPHTALIKSSGNKNVHIVIGGRLFAFPIIHKVDRLSLSLRTIVVRTVNGVTNSGVLVNITSVCQVKIQGWTTTTNNYSSPQFQSYDDATNDLHTDVDAVRLAAQHFLGKSDAQIEDTIQNTISGHQRAIVGSLEVEGLYNDRATFCKRVLDLISSDMRNMGLTVVSYTVTDVNDSNGYIEALGVTKTEQIKREAVEGAAVNRGAAKSKSAQEEADAHIEVNSQTQRKIGSDRNRVITEAKAKVEIEHYKAIQAKAYDISCAKEDAALLVARKQARAAETRGMVLVAEQEVKKERLLKEKEVNVEADALLYKAQVAANAVRISASAEADRVRAIGNAEAKCAELKGMAEVEILQERIIAWQNAYVFQSFQFSFLFYMQTVIFRRCIRYVCSPILTKFTILTSSL